MVNLTEEDVGKRVVERSGSEIGQVSSVEHDAAFVDPDPGITDSIKSKLGWQDVDEDDYKLDMNEIDTVTDNEIRLR